MTLNKLIKIFWYYILILAILYYITDLFTLISSNIKNTNVKYATVPDISNYYHQDSLFMQVVEPEEIAYLFKVRPAKNFGTDFVSMLNQSWVTQSYLSGQKYLMAMYHRIKFHN